MRIGFDEMNLTAVLKIVFLALYILWAIALFMSMPPKTIMEAVIVLISAAVIFVIGYFFHLYLIRTLMKLIKAWLRKR